MYTINLNSSDNSITVSHTPYTIDMPILARGYRGQIGNGADALVINGKSSDVNDVITLLPSDFTHVISNKSDNYTATNTDDVIRFTANATLTLPHATGSGRKYIIVSDGAIVTIDAYQSELISGETTQVIDDNESITIIDTATNKWNIV